VEKVKLESEGEDLLQNEENLQVKDKKLEIQTNTQMLLLLREEKLERKSKIHKKINKNHRHSWYLWFLFIIQ
jgi:hypothetical protein